MRECETYEQWLEARRRVRVPEGLTRAVMGRVAAVEAKRGAGMKQGVRDVILARASGLVRLASAVCLSALGLYRLWCVAMNLFVPF